MSKVQPSSDNVDVQTTEEHEKTVVITAYADGDYVNGREFIDDILGDQDHRDLFETETKENRTVEIEVAVVGKDDDGYDVEFNESIDVWSGYEKEAIANYFKDKETPDYLNITDTVTTEEQHAYSAVGFPRRYLQQFMHTDLLNDFGFNGMEFSSYTGAWDRSIPNPSVDADEDDKIKQYCRVRTLSAITPRRPLVHQSKRTKANRYEGEDELWSFQVQVDIECSTEDELDGISERLVTTIYDELWSIDKITSVRLESCSQSVKKDGECYNI